MHKRVNSLLSSLTTTTLSLTFTQPELPPGVPPGVLKSTLFINALYLFVPGVWCYVGQLMERWIMDSGSKQLRAEMRPACWYIISNHVHYVFFLIWLWCASKLFASLGWKNHCIPLTSVSLPAVVFAVLNLTAMCSFLQSLDSQYILSIYRCARKAESDTK